MAKIARRKLALHLAEQLHKGVSPKKLAAQTAAYLLEHRQTGDWELVIRDVEEILSTSYGVTSARITSARPLDEATRSNLTVFIREAEGVKEVVVSEELVDESLIGGVIIRTPSSVFDSSIRTKLRKLQATTKE
jgi:F-type H+-transporting ATPase subunit delta